MLALDDEAMPIDLLTVTERLHRQPGDDIGRPALEIVGGPKALGALVNGQRSIRRLTNAVSHAARWRDIVSDMGCQPRHATAYEIV